MSAIDTGKVTDRRSLRYAGLDEMLTDANRIAAAERAGALRRSGNWSPGQAFGHVASWIDYAYDGYPPELRPPWFIKLYLRTRRNQFLKGPLPSGVKIPKIKGGTTATEPLPLEEGLSRLTRAAQRLKTAPPAEPNIVFGPLSHEEWMQLHCRHAELHLSFFHPPEGGA